MKKSLINFAFIAVLAVAPLAAAPSAMAVTVPNWNLLGTWTFNDIYQSVPYVHTMVIDSFDPITGNFSGHGFYNADPSLTWTITGNESGGVVSYTLFTGGSDPGVTLLGSGTMDSATAMHGTGSQDNLPGPMPNVSWTATETSVPVVTIKSQCMNNGWKSVIDTAGNSFKNQGDCVSFVATKGKNLAAGN